MLLWSLRYENINNQIKHYTHIHIKGRYFKVTLIIGP